MDNQESKLKKGGRKNHKMMINYANGPNYLTTDHFFLIKHYPSKKKITYI